MGIAVPIEIPLMAEQPLSIREAFVANLTQHTTSILVVPSSIRHSTKTQTAGVTPRRSRRIAGAKAGCNLNQFETR
jgi:hypothetical protein